MSSAPGADATAGLRAGQSRSGIGAVSRETRLKVTLIRGSSFLFFQVVGALRRQCSQCLCKLPDVTKRSPEPSLYLICFDPCRNMKARVPFRQPPGYDPAHW